MRTRTRTQKSIVGGLVLSVALASGMRAANARPSVDLDGGSGVSDLPRAARIVGVKALAGTKPIRQHCATAATDSGRKETRMLTSAAISTEISEDMYREYLPSVDAASGPQKEGSVELRLPSADAPAQDCRRPLWTALTHFMVLFR